MYQIPICTKVGLAISFSIGIHNTITESTEMGLKEVLDAIEKKIIQLDK
jgi:hypothetical protein